jgi:hypothetical protein
MILTEIMEIKMDIESSNMEQKKILQQDLMIKKDNLYQEIISLTNQNLINQACDKIILLKFLDNI